MSNFIRKWGTPVKHDTFMKPIIHSKYDIGIVIKNSNIEIIRALEPWCSTIYTEIDIMEYITLEQSNTSMDLKDRVKPYDNEKQNQILIDIDANLFNQQDFQYLSQLSEILKDSGAVGEFQLGNLKITIIALDTFEQNLINN